MRFISVIPWFAVSMLMLAVAGCGGGEEGGDYRGEQRIVTLSPSLTQMLVDSGASDLLVGVGEHDAAAPPGMPVVGHFVDVDTEKLLSLEPTHVMTVRTRQEPPRRLRNLAAAGRFELLVYPYPYTIDAALEVLHNRSRAESARTDGDTEDSGAGGVYSPPSVGEVLGMPERAAALEMRVRRQLEAVGEVTAGRERLSVLMLIGTRSLMASGPGSVLDELLDYAGGRNAAAGASVSAPTYDREALTALAPEVIVLLLPHAPPLTENDPRLAELRGLPVPAVENGRIHLINDPLAVLPSTNMPAAAAALAKAIHPSLAGELDERLERIARESAQ